MLAGMVQNAVPGRRVVVTGASRGLGLELVRQHAAKGDRVFATCRTPASARALAEVAEAHADRVVVARLDVASQESIEESARHAEKILGGFDVLWSNAGVYPGSPGTTVAEGTLGTLSAADAMAVLSINSIGAILVAQAFMPLLRRGHEPRLAAISSGYGSLELNQGTPYWYGASKAALNMLHRSLASDPAAGGVTVLLVSPGWVQTDMGGSSAPTSVEESVAGMMRVVARATPADSGRFFDWQGAVVPW